MAASNALLAIGITFEVETATDSGVFFQFEELTNVVPPQSTVEQIDVTHMESPGRYREFIPGYADGGEMTIEMNYIPGSDTDDFILAWQIAGEVRSTRITYPALQTDTTPATVQGYAPTMSVGEKMAATLTLKVAGEPVRG